MKKGSYVGQIKNAGSQIVKSPLATGEAKKGTVKRGDDLRCGTGKSSK